MLRPLTLDVVPSISQTACIALGRMAAESKEVAQGMVELDILPQIVFRCAHELTKVSRTKADSSRNAPRMFFGRLRDTRRNWREALSRTTGCFP